MPSYSFSFEVCHPSKASIVIAKQPQVILASVGRGRLLRSKNHPHQILAAVAAIPDVNDARVLARTEKLRGPYVSLPAVVQATSYELYDLMHGLATHYLVKYMPRYTLFHWNPIKMGIRR